MGRTAETSASNAETGNLARPSRAAKLSAEDDATASAGGLDRDRWATFKLGSTLASTRRPAAATGRVLALVVDVVGIVIFSAAMVIIANLLTDLVYRLIDPRIRVGGSR